MIASQHAPPFALFDPESTVTAGDQVPTPESDLEMMLRYLDDQRRHVLAAFDGLDEFQMRQEVAPSSWSPIALLHHLTIDVELWWFGAIVAGDLEVRATVDAANGWRPPPEVTARGMRQRYRQAAARSDGIIRRVGLAADLAWWPEDMPRHRRHVADVVLHVIAETAAHAGHADLGAELLDGRQWLVLD